MLAFLTNIVVRRKVATPVHKQLEYALNKRVETRFHHGPSLYSVAPKRTNAARSSVEKNRHFDLFLGHDGI